MEGLRRPAGSGCRSGPVREQPPPVPCPRTRRSRGTQAAAPGVRGPDSSRSGGRSPRSSPRRDPGRPPDSRHRPRRRRLRPRHPPAGPRDRLPHRPGPQAVRRRRGRPADPPGPGPVREPGGPDAANRKRGLSAPGGRRRPGQGKSTRSLRVTADPCPPAVQIRHGAGYVPGAVHRGERVRGTSAPPEEAGSGPPGLFMAIGRGRWNRSAGDSGRGCWSSFRSSP